MSSVPSSLPHERRLKVMNYRRNITYENALVVDKKAVEKFEEKTAQRIKEGRKKLWVPSSLHSS